MESFGKINSSENIDTGKLLGKEEDSRDRVKSTFAVLHTKRSMGEPTHVEEHNFEEAVKTLKIRQQALTEAGMPVFHPVDEYLEELEADKEQIVDQALNG